MSPPVSEGNQGIFAATRDGSATLLAAARTRLELLGNELKEEKLRAVRLLLLSQLFAFCLALGTVLAVGLLVVLHWDERIVLLLTASGLFFVIAGSAYASLVRAVRQAGHPFSASLAELREDIEQLKRTVHNEPGTD